MSGIKDQFLLDPQVTFLNHGSFGAIPRPVLEVYQDWQVYLERQPVKFLSRELMAHLELARESLAVSLMAPADDLAYIPNVTYGVNLIARALHLGPEDEVLTTDHEYGACDNVWEFMCQRKRSSYIRRSIPLPIWSDERFVEHLWQRVTPRTKVVYLSHVSSPTAQQFPIDLICKKARSEGILTVIDGAHAPGQIQVNLTSMDPDFYIGNCHKWMMGPKGSGFLYARRDKQHLVEPLIVSWGWDEDFLNTTGSKFLDYLQWAGTTDPSAFLSVPAAIHFQSAFDWPKVRRRCHKLVEGAVRRICHLTGMSSLYEDDQVYLQMAIAPLPPIENLAHLQMVSTNYFKT